MKTKDMDTDIVVTKKNGFAYINDIKCSFETKRIRSFVNMVLENNESFILPKNYTYVITEINGFAKIIKK